MVLELIKNPIIIGFIIATITYIYLEWKRNKKLKKKYVKDVNLLIPIGVGGIIGLIAYYIFNQSASYNNNPDIICKNPLCQNMIKSLPYGGIAGIPMIEQQIPKDDLNQSFHLVGRSITIPHNIPDLNEF